MPQSLPRMVLQAVYEDNEVEEGWELRGRYEEKEQVFTQQAVISAQHLHSQQKERFFEKDCWETMHIGLLWQNFWCQMLFPSGSCCLPIYVPQAAFSLKISYCCCCTQCFHETELLCTYSHLKVKCWAREGFLVYLILLSLWQINRMYLSLTEMALKSEMKFQMKKYIMFVLFSAVSNAQITKPVINAGPLLWSTFSPRKGQLIWWDLSQMQTKGCFLKLAATVLVH